MSDIDKGTHAEPTLRQEANGTPETPPADAGATLETLEKLIKASERSRQEILREVAQIRHVHGAELARIRDLQKPMFYVTVGGFILLAVLVGIQFFL